MNDETIRQKVKNLKSFYTEIMNYTLVNTLFVLIWVTFDRNEIFWPKYIILLWGILIFFKAYQKNLFPFFFSRLSFLSPIWEERKVNELMGKPSHQRKIHLKRHLKK